MKWFSRPAMAPAADPFEALVRPHLEGLFRLAYRFTRSREDAEDLVQGLLVKLLAQPERLGEVEQLGPWLARSLYYFHVDHLRQRRRADKGLGLRVADEEVLTAVVDEQREGPEQAAERGQLGRRLEVALGRLSAEHRALIGLHDIEGYKLEELAGMLELPIGTLKSRLHRGRAHLRWLLEAAEATDQVRGVRVAI